MDSQLSGVAINKRVLDYKNREMGDFYVLDIDHILPPLSKDVLLEKGSICQVCCTQTQYRRSCFKYESSKLKHAKDFNLTLEHLDSPGTRELIISNKARLILKENGIKLLSQPVVLLDNNG